MDHSTLFLGSLRSSPVKKSTSKSRFSTSIGSPSRISTSKSKEYDNSLTISTNNFYSNSTSNSSSNSPNNSLNSTQKYQNNLSSANSASLKMWEPPVSCQRRILSSTSKQFYFPLELTERDYFNRLISLIVLSLHELDSDFLKTRVSNTKLIDFSGSSAEFSNILLANCLISKSEKLGMTLNQLYNQSDALKNMFNKISEEFIQIRENFLNNTSGWGSLYHLNNNFLVLFEITKNFIQNLKNFSLWRMEPPQTRTPIDKISIEVSDLFQQYKLHKLFKEQRMNFFGWEEEEEIKENNFSSSITSSNINNSNVTLSSQNINQLYQSYDDIYSIVNSYKNSVTFGKIQLYSRLIYLIDDLHLLCRQLSYNSHFNEAKRIKKLTYYIEQSIDNEDKIFIDNIHLETQRLSFLSINLLRESSKRKVNMDIVNSEKCEINGIAGQELAKEINQILEKDSLIFHLASITSNQTNNLPMKVLSEVITSDYLFVTPFQKDSQSIASLIVRSNESKLLAKIETWPDFSIIRGNNKSLNSLPQPPSHNNQSPPPPPFINQNSSSTNQNYNNLNASYSQSVPMTAHDLNNNFNEINISHNNSIRSPMKTQSPMLNHSNLQHSINYSPNPNSNYSSTNSLLLTSKRFTNTNSFLESNNNMVISNVILSTLKSFDDLKKILSLLLTPVALSHTELNLRLISIRDSLYYLVNINNQNGEERDRLMELVTVFDQTIDADEEDYFDDSNFTLSNLYEDINNSVHNLANSLDDLYFNPNDPSNFNQSNVNGFLEKKFSPFTQHTNIINTIGRGRKRIDNIYLLCEKVEESIEDLHSLHSKLLLLENFTACSSIKEMIETLKQSLDNIYMSLVRINLLGHEKENYDNYQSNSFNMSKNKRSFYSNEFVLTNGMSVIERVACEGTGFITSDWLFTLTWGPLSHSIGSLAIVSGAGSILRFIKSRWPNLTVLGNNIKNKENEISNSTSLANNSNHRSNQDFRDANTLRLMGFDPMTLLASGFTPIDILTAGYTVDQLRTAGFSINDIHSLSGIQSDQLLKLASADNNNTENNLFKNEEGFNNDSIFITLEILHKFFKQTSGNFWKRRNNWESLLNFYNQLESNQDNYTKQQRYSRYQTLISNCSGIKINPKTRSIDRIELIQNNLKGFLPSCISVLNSLTTLVLRSNKLEGKLPPEFSCLIHLTTLDLGDNQLDGIIPNSWQYLKNIQSFILDKNKLEGNIPTFFSFYSQLRRLDLSFNSFSGSLPPITCNYLESLKFNNNKLQGPLNNTIIIPSLRHLEIQNNNLSGPIPNEIYRLDKLTLINIEGNVNLIIDKLNLQKCIPRCRIKL